MINFLYNSVFLIALAVFIRSSAAYEALKSFQLPSLQSYTGAFLHSPCANSACIADQVAPVLSAE